ncbi:conjugal transfer relaxase TraA [uncultured Coprococcus sp.]|nr:MobA/MobL family protein [uncultured Coprococcus sp.]SCI34315.1 conjugal transfer relaxase TraA [uncultured Coprococcus sp.]
MAIFHFTVKIVGRSKGKSVISASAYLNGDVMKNEETGRISYYTSKKEVVYTSLMMCENAPPEWLHVPEENIKRFQQSIRYKRADDKDAALEKFKITFQKQRLWNEVLKIEKNADAQLGPIKLAKSSSLSRQNNSVNIAEGQRIRVNGGHVLTVTAHGVEVSGGDNPYDTQSYVKAQRMADALASMLRNAGGTMTTVAHSKEEYARYTEGITDVMSYLGVDTSKDFTVNGMKYSKNKDGWYESEANSDAQAAYEQLKANNRTYQFADEKTKKQIAYISDYYLQTVPESVKAAWQETLEETGFNPFQTDVTSTLTQLSVEQDFLTGGDDNIFGETKESCLAAIDKVLERIENPLAAVTEERAAYLQQEKEFYTVLASKIRE